MTCIKRIFLIKTHQKWVFFEEIDNTITIHVKVTLQLHKNKLIKN